MIDARTQAHPGGEALTRRLLEMAVLAPCNIIDMGAGGGGTMRLLDSLGFNAAGVDVKPGEGVITGDFLHCPFPDALFDAAICECSFFVSGDAPGAFREVARLLRPGGKLLFSDVFFGSGEELIRMAEDAGLRMLQMEDATPLWREYYLSCVWAGTEKALCACVPKGKCFYYLMIAERSR